MTNFQLTRLVVENLLTKSSICNRADIFWVIQRLLLDLAYPHGGPRWI